METQNDRARSLSFFLVMSPVFQDQARQRDYSYWAGRISVICFTVSNHRAMSVDAGGGDLPLPWALYLGRRSCARFWNVHGSIGPVNVFEKNPWACPNGSSWLGQRKVSRFLIAGYRFPATGKIRIRFFHGNDVVTWRAGCLLRSSFQSLPSSPTRLLKTHRW